MNLNTVNWQIEADTRFAMARIHERVDRMALNAKCELIKMANHKREEMNLRISHHRRSMGQIRRHWGSK